MDTTNAQERQPAGRDSHLQFNGVIETAIAGSEEWHVLVVVVIVPGHPLEAKSLVRQGPLSRPNLTQLEALQCGVFVLSAPFWSPSERVMLVNSSAVAVSAVVENHAHDPDLSRLAARVRKQVGHRIANIRCGDAPYAKRIAEAVLREARHG